MKKIIILIATLGVVTLGGTVLSKSISGTNGNQASAILGSLTGQKLRRAELAIDGMWCASCATGVEYNLKAIEGVADTYVGFTDDLEGEGWVIFEQGKVSEEQIIKAVEPYKATITADTVYTE
jgi:copper chaperone CopZ